MHVDHMHTLKFLDFNGGLSGGQILLPFETMVGNERFTPVVPTRVHASLSMVLEQCMPSIMLLRGHGKLMRLSHRTKAVCFKQFNYKRDVFAGIMGRVSLQKLVTSQREVLDTVDMT